MQVPIRASDERQADAGHGPSSETASSPTAATVKKWAATNDRVAHATSGVFIACMWPTDQCLLRIDGPWTAVPLARQSRAPEIVGRPAGWMHELQQTQARSSAPKGENASAFCAAPRRHAQSRSGACRQRTHPQGRERP